jgi:NADH-quinone oxidoreductase subunit B
MLLDAIMQIHEKSRQTKLGINRQNQITELEEAALAATPTSEMKGLLR